ncbi:MAG TPA: YdcF family protein [Chitinophagales bacterium]|nr:YdcF family protein [Chitinophagales bacterium]
MRKQHIAFLFLAILLFSSFGLKEQVDRARKRNFAKVPYDVLIVPGYPYYESGKAPYPLLEARMNWVKELYEQGVAKNIIFSGGTIHSPYNEARLMKIISDTLGIPQDHVYLEEHAPHSFQNVTYGAKLARKLGFKKIAIATDPFQFAYMRLFLGAAPGVRILTFSPDSSVAGKYFKDLPYYDPKGAFVKEYKAE